MINPGNTILFQGDSITDCGRDRDRQNTPNDTEALGNGYASITATEILKKRPADNLNFHNYGISGNKIYQLLDRWQQDCIDLKPDILTILIGINDLWHHKEGQNHRSNTPEKFEAGYRQLLTLTRKELPETKIIIAQPFAIKGGAIKDDWLPELQNYQQVAEKMAKEFKTKYIPLQTVFDQAVKDTPKNHYSQDGVHPSPIGHQLMANQWLKLLN